MEHLIRTRLAEDIVAEVAFPERQQGKIAIVCGGAPGSPSKKEVLLFLASQGYVAFGIRYRGTWESEGYFLKHSPAQDVADTIEYLVQHKKVIDAWSQKQIPIKLASVDLFGASFGGPAVLLNSQHPKVRKVIALAPVIDWNGRSIEESFEQFVRFSETGFGGAYRLQKKSDWKKLFRTDFYNPITMTEDIDASKCFIIQTQDDKVCLPEHTKALQELLPLKAYYKPQGGHLGTNHVRQQFYWKKIEQFLKKK